MYTAGCTVKSIIHQLTILDYQQRDVEQLSVLQKQLAEKKVQVFDFNFQTQKLTTHCVPLTCTIADDICLVKETPTIFCISRRLECSFRRFVLESLYSEKFKKLFKSGEDQRICGRV